MNNEINIFKTLGLVAKDDPLRARENGSAFEPLFPQPHWTEFLLERNGKVDDTVKGMQDVIKTYAWQTAKLAAELRGETVRQSCKNIWNFLYDHIKYQEDDDGKEQLRTPARSWAERRSRGIDCDDFTIFAGTLLYNLNIPFYIRIARYEQDSPFSHVYNVIPQSKENYIVIDGVLPQFDAEKPPIETKDFLVMSKSNLNGVNISVLGGLDDELYNEVAGILSGIDFENVQTLEGLGNPVDEEEYLGAIKNYLMRTRSFVARHPQMIADVESPSAFLGMLDYALNYWDTDKREEALGVLENEENRINELNGLGAVLESNEDVDLVYGLTSEGTYDLLGKVKAPKKFFTKVKQATQKVAQKTKQAVKKVSTSKPFKAIVRYNPLTASIRASVLLALKANLLHSASKYKWGYLTREEAQSRGFDMNEWQKVKSGLAKAEHMFVNELQGKAENFKNAILTGRAGGLSGLELGLGVVVATTAAASTAAATPFITKILNLLKNVNFSKLVANVKTLKLKKKTKQEDLLIPTPEGGSAMPEGGDATETPKNETEASAQNNENKTVDDQQSGSNDSTATNNTSNSAASDNSSGSEQNEINTSSAPDGKTMITASPSNENTTGNEQAEENDPRNQEKTGERGAAPATTHASAKINFLTRAVDWVKENPGTSVAIGAGAAFLVWGLSTMSGKESKHALSGLGQKNKKGRRRRGKKKNNPPNVISGFKKGTSKQKQRKKKNKKKRKHQKHSGKNRRLRNRLKRKNSTGQIKL